MVNDAKPFKGVGSGVIEIAIKFEKDAYRCVQAIQLGKKIYGLHAFQKDIELIKQRYKDARELDKND